MATPKAYALLGKPYKPRATIDNQKGLFDEYVEA
jgi:hypothetical protein